MAAQAVVLSAEAVVMAKNLSYALHDRAHCLAPGLFRSLASGDRKRLKLDITYKFGENEQIEFKGYEPLGVLEMRVLQGLIAMCGPDGLILEHEDEASSDGVQLMLSMFDPDPALRAARSKPPSLVVRDSLRRLAREIGMCDGGKNLVLIRQSIERLFAVTVFVQSGKKRMGMRMLASYASEEGTGDLYVSLNPRIASAILGNIPHARIELNEARRLDTDPARLIHQRLSGWIDPGKSGVVTIETLSRYVWPEPSSDATERKRNSRIRSAVAEIGGIWRVSEQTKDVWQFIRPRTIGHKSP